MDYHFPGFQIPIKARYQANARERDRTQRYVGVEQASVNTAFIILRAMIPTEPMDRKLSKIETIRLATKYINHLAAALETDSGFNPCSLLQDGIYQGALQPNSLCTFCISDYKRYVKSMNQEAEKVDANFEFPLT